MVTKTKDLQSTDQLAQDKWKLARQRAQRTATWAKTMTRVLISQSTGSQPPWHVVNFLGPKKAESRGVVDLLAIRRNHHEPNAPLKRGDLFEMVLLQVKGGTAKWPSVEDRVRLRAVQKTYGAKEVLLSEWKQGAKPKLFRLVEDQWSQVLDPAEIFAPTASQQARRKVKELIADRGTRAPLPTIEASGAGSMNREGDDSPAKRAWATRRLNSRSK